MQARYRSWNAPILFILGAASEPVKPVPGGGVRESSSTSGLR
jgi:hypothetical protein